jgi:hypothetical protein
MSDTLPNIILQANTWTNLYTETGLSTLNGISVQVLGNTTIKLAISAAEPTDENATEEHSPGNNRFRYGGGGSPLWAISKVDKNVINVKDEELNNTVINDGIPTGVTRKLRIEGHIESLVGSNVWNDIWEGGALTIPEPNQSVGQQIQILSTGTGAANDTLAGTGAQRVRLDFITTDNVLVFEELDLDGVTPVLTTATNITDIIDFHSVQVGSTGAAVGTIDVTDVAGPSVVYNRITPLGNKSLTTLRHLLPSSTFYITDLVLSGDTKGVDVIFRSDSSDGGTVYPGVFLFNVPVTMSDAPSVIKFNPALEIPGTARMKVSARGQAAGSSISVFINGWVKI